MGKMSLFFRVVLVVSIALALCPSFSHALGVSSRNGNGLNYGSEASIIPLPLKFMNFHYDKTETIASEIGYPEVNYDRIDSKIIERFKKKEFYIIDGNTFALGAQLDQETNGRAVGQLYQDFAQLLKDGQSVVWPLLDKVKTYRLGRQFGNTLSRVPYDFNGKYLLVPMGIEFENEKHQIFGFIGTAVVDKNLEIVTAAAVRYDPTKLRHKDAEDLFIKLVNRCIKEIRKRKNKANPTVRQIDSPPIASHQPPSRQPILREQEVV